MKNANKKAGAIALSGMMVSGVFLSSGLSVNADTSTPNITIEQFYANKMVVKYEDVYGYISTYLAKKPEKKRIDATYSSEWDFKDKIQKGDLNRFKGRNCIYIQIGENQNSKKNAYFRLTFNKFRTEHAKLVWKKLVDYTEEYGLKILIYGEASYTGKTVFNASIRTMFGYDKKLMNYLLEKSPMYYNNVDELTKTKDPERLFDDKGYLKLRVDDLLFLLQK